MDQHDKVFTVPSNLRDHKLIHAGIRQHVCDVCSKTGRHLEDIISLSYHIISGRDGDVRSCYALSAADVMTSTVIMLTLSVSISNAYCIYSFSLFIFFCTTFFFITEEAVQRVKCEKTAEQAVLRVEVKTEDRDQLEHEVRVSSSYSSFYPPKLNFEYY
jgi:hypothetical protein